MAQVRALGPRVGGRLALFCIHRVNRVYGNGRKDGRETAAHYSYSRALKTLRLRESESDKSLS